jgi:uncharacterized protein (DUF1778 family)
MAKNAQINIRMNKATAEMIKRVANQDGRSMTSYIVWVLSESNAEIKKAFLAELDKELK